MMKRIFSSLVVLLLVAMLTVCAFAAAGGGYSSLALKADTSVDYTALEEGDVFTVYIVLNPMLQAGATANSVYRPYTSVSTAKNEDAALNNNFADLYGQTFTVSWNTEYFELAPATEGAAPVTAVTTQSGLSDATADFTTSDGKTLYFVSATKQLDTPANVIAATKTAASVAGPVEISYVNGNNVKFIGYIVAGKGEDNILGCIAAINLKVKKAPAEATAFDITLSDTYLRPTASNSQTQTTNVSVTVAAGCQHINKTNINVTKPASCYDTGLRTYDCSDCGTTGIPETIPLEPHTYNEADRVTVPATCTTAGESYILCSVPECRHKGEVINYEATGHTWAYGTIGKVTCTTSLKEFFYCEVCKCLATVFPNGVSVEDHDKFAAVDNETVFNPADNKFYTDVTYTTEKENSEYGDAVHMISSLGGHAWVKNSDGEVYCENAAEGKCNGASPYVIYVGNKLLDSAFGDTPENYMTYDKAIEHFADGTWDADFLGTDKTCYIVLVEDIVITRHIVSDTLTDKESKEGASKIAAFEENPHTVNIVVTSYDKENPSTFTFGSGHPDETKASEYYLYGNTTFEYINIASEVAGTASDGGVYFCGRGFELTMGHGLKMMGGSIGERSKTDANITGFGTTVNIPNAKVYAIAGVKSGNAQDGFDPTNGAHFKMNVLSGEYWSIYRFSRGPVTKHTNVTSTVVIGDITTDTLLVNTEDGVELENCHSVTIYNGEFNIKLDHAMGYNGKVTGEGNKHDRIYLPGISENSKLGDFALNKAFNIYSDETVYYYEGALGKNMRDNVFVEGFVEKIDVAFANAYFNYNMSIAPLYEWCGTYGEKFFGISGGHNYNEDGICTFCGLHECSSHDVTETRIVKEPNCSEDGIMQEYCVRCLSVIEEIAIPATADEHEFAWTGIGSTPEVKCTICGTVNEEVTVPTDFTKIYVSYYGTAFGGFSADDPLNDFDTAMKFAAKANAPATIYIIDKVVVKNNTAFGNDVSNYTYDEPTHANVITIRGYGSTKGIFEFGGGSAVGVKMDYLMNGPVVFEQLEFSTGMSPSKAYIIARHNSLVIGKNVSADMQRLTGTSTSMTSQITLIGGCRKPCANVNKATDMTICSGVFSDIIGCGISSNCKSAVNLRVLGDVTVTEFMILSGYSPTDDALTAGDVTFELDGNISCAQYVAFAPFGEKGSVGKVTLVLRSGIIVTDTHSSIVARPIGTSSEKDRTTKPTDRMTSLTIYYNPAENSTKTLADKIALSSDRGKLSIIPIIENEFCSANSGNHTRGEVVSGTTTVEPTCYSVGYETVTCTACGKTYKNPLAALDHTFEADGAQPVTTIAATCANPALEMYVCGNDGCNAVEYRTAMVNVGTEEEPEMVPSTALDASVLANHKDIKNGACTICKKSIVDICASREGGHNYVATAITKSCGTGTAYSCSDCGHAYVDITGATHNYGAFSVSVEPTETAPGVKSRTCKDCGKVDTALLYAADSIYTEAVATGADGSIADLDIASSKLSKYEREALNSLLQSTSYGSEVKVSYKVEGDTVTGITYSIPVPAEYSKMTNVKVIVKDDSGVLHTVDFVIEKGYFVFTF